MKGPNKPRIVVFVHGWSVSHTDTYGGLPERLRVEAASRDLAISVREIFLGRYVTFRDEVRVEDISKAFEAAVRRELEPSVRKQGRFACITHSTGGLVVRDWWRRYYAAAGRRCPMSHVVMLAPPNFGSALAQLGASRISRIDNWFHGMEPGRGVLDWLELGSPEVWELNREWIGSGSSWIGASGVFPFVLAGQTIDRRRYDPIVALTGESGSDGVVRAAAANLNTRYVRLEQEAPRAIPDQPERFHAPRLVLREPLEAPSVPFRIIAGAAHSGPARGIQRGVSRRKGATKGAEVVRAILDCLTVRDRRGFEALAGRFERETDEVQRRERVEIADRVLLPESVFVHDRHAMVIVRVQDEEGHAVDDVDLVLTGRDHDMNRLPRGFLSHTQASSRHPGTMTYFFDHDVMLGTDAVEGPHGVLREALPGSGALGLMVRPRPISGFVHYMPCDLQASREFLEAVLLANRTTLVDVVLRRVVGEGVFRLERGTRRRSFKQDPPGRPIRGRAAP